MPPLLTVTVIMTITITIIIIIIIIIIVIVIIIGFFGFSKKPFAFLGFWKNRSLFWVFGKTVRFLRTDDIRQKIIRYRP